MEEHNLGYMVALMGSVTKCVSVFDTQKRKTHLPTPSGVSTSDIYLSLKNSIKRREKERKIVSVTCQHCFTSVI